MVENMDERVGRLVDAADELGIRDRTLFIFTADNGTPKSYYFTAEGGKMFKQPIEFAWKGQSIKGGKGELSDGGTRVPLVANWPGKLERGKVVDDLVDFSDWFPTFVELAGGSAPEGLDGVSLADRLRGGGASSRSWAFAERNSMRWVRTQRWKLYDDGRLYDMSDGREELTPVTISSASQEALQAKTELEGALRGLALAD
jgi:arylsulfatase A-like enzyme